MTYDRDWQPLVTFGSRVIFCSTCHLTLDWHYITIDLQCDESLKSKFQFESTADCNKKYILPSGKYKNILTNAKLMKSLFESTYTCEQLFSKMKYTKSHLKTRLCDDHLDDVLLLSSTNIPPDVEKLSHNKQKQVSYNMRADDITI